MSEQDDGEIGQLMLHYGESGPVELELWDEEAEEATHLFTAYPRKPNHSEDITRDLERAGYRLVEAADVE